MNEGDIVACLWKVIFWLEMKAKSNFLGKACAAEDAKLVCLHVNQMSKLCCEISFNSMFLLLAGKDTVSDWESQLAIPEEFIRGISGCLPGE